MLSLDKIEIKFEFCRSKACWSDLNNLKFKLKNCLESKMKLEQFQILNAQIVLKTVELKSDFLDLVRHV